jgi:hypothetical protein
VLPCLHLTYTTDIAVYLLLQYSSTFKHVTLVSCYLQYSRIICSLVFVSLTYSIVGSTFLVLLLDNAIQRLSCKCQYEFHDHVLPSLHLTHSTVAMPVYFLLQGSTTFKDVTLFSCYLQYSRIICSIVLVAITYSLPTDLLYVLPTVQYVCRCISCYRAV